MHVCIIVCKLCSKDSRRLLFIARRIKDDANVKGKKKNKLNRIVWKLFRIFFNTRMYKSISWILNPIFKIEDVSWKNMFFEKICYKYFVKLLILNNVTASDQFPRIERRKTESQFAISLRRIEWKKKENKKSRNGRQRQPPHFEIPFSKVVDR